MNVLTLGSTQCSNPASEEARRTDADLTGIYQKVLSAAGSQSTFIEKIKAAEKAWIAYRDGISTQCIPRRTSRLHTAPSSRWKSIFFDPNWHANRLEENPSGKIMKRFLGVMLFLTVAAFGQAS